MTRNKLNLAYIPNDSLRKSTFNKRKKGFVKKINELSVLCGIEACAVIYNPFTSNPELWPSYSGVKNVVDKFEKLPKMDQEKKMVNHEGFLRQSITKAVETNTKKAKDNMERTMKEIMFLFLGGKENNLMLTGRTCEDLCKYVDQYLKELYHHRKEISDQPLLANGESSSTGVNNVMAPPTPITEVGPSSFFPNPDVCNSSHHQANELWGLKQEKVNTFGNNFLHAPSEQQDYYQMLNPVSVFNHHPNLYFTQNQFQQHQHQHQHEQFKYPNVAQDGMYNPNRQEEWMDNKMMMNHQDEQMRFRTMDGNKNRYYHHQRP